MKIFLKIIILLLLTSNCAVVHREIDFRDREFSIEALKYEFSYNSKKLKTLKGDGKILIESIESHDEANAEIYMKFPDSLMIKLEGPFGIDMVHIFVGKGELKYYNIKENLKYIGKYEEFEDLTGVKLKFIEVAELLGGKLNSILTGETIDVFEKAGEYIIVSKVDDGFEEYFIDKRIWEIKKYIKLNKDREIVLEKQFNRFKRRSGFFIPQIIRYIKPPDQRITLIYKRVRVNERINPSKFNLVIPQSAREIVLQK